MQEMRWVLKPLNYVIVYQPIVSFWPNDPLYEEELENEKMRELP